MKKIKEHDIVLIDNNRLGTVIHIYNDKNFVIEIIDNGKSSVETISIDRISKIKK